MCIFRVICIRLDTTLDERSGKRERERNLLGLDYFRAWERLFSSARTLISPSNIMIVLHSVCAIQCSFDKNRVDAFALDKHHALSPLLFFSRHLTNGRREENETQRQRTFLSLPVSFITSLHDSPLVLTITSLANNNNSETPLFVFCIIELLLFCSSVYISSNTLVFTDQIKFNLPLLTN